MRWMLCIGLLVAGAWAGAEEEKFLLVNDDHGIPVGTKVEFQGQRDIKKGKMRMLTGGEWTTGRMSGKDEGLWVVERPEENVYIIRYRKSQGKYRMLFGGEKQQNVQDYPLHKKVVRFEKREGKWRSRIIEGDLEDADLDKLEKTLAGIERSLEKGYAKALFGTKPRKVGETWKADEPRLPSMGDEKALEGEANVTFEKIEEIDGEKFASLKVVFDLTAQYDVSEETTVNLKGEGVILRSLKTFRDREFSASGKLRMESKGEDYGVESNADFRLLQKVLSIGKLEKE